MTLNPESGSLPGSDPRGEAMPFVIRPPTPAERRACRMLLPAATGAAQRSQLHVAVCGPERRVVGAAALGLDGRPELCRGWQVDVRVIVPFRRRGIGRALMARLVGQAAAHGVRALHAWEWVEPQSEPARAWTAFGFAPCQRRLEFETDLVAAHAKVLPLYQKLRAEDRIPAAARIVPLADADLDAVVRLHVRCLGGTRRLLMPMLRGVTPDAYHPTLSRVLLMNGNVAGFTLGRIGSDGVCEVDANVVDPALRLGWANLWLKMEAGERLLAEGIHTLRYFSFQQHTDTQRISRQVGAKLVRTLVQMRRELTAAPPAPPPPPTGDAGAGAGG